MWYASGLNGEMWLVGLQWSNGAKTACWRSPMMVDIARPLRSRLAQKLRHSLRLLTAEGDQLTTSLFTEKSKWAISK